MYDTGKKKFKMIHADSRILSRTDFDEDLNRHEGKEDIMGENVRQEQQDMIFNDTHIFHFAHAD